MDKQRLTEKIKNLLDLANSENEHEAKAAAEMANRLLTKYNLSMQEVESVSEYTDGEITTKARVSQEDKWILPLIRDFYFVNPLIVTKYKGYHNSRRQYAQVIRFVGEKTNVDVAAYTYEFLTREFRALFKKYRQETGCGPKSKESYYYGLTQGLKEQLKRAQTAVQQETGLVLVRDPGVQKFMDKQYPKTTSKVMKSSAGSDGHAVNQGVHDGNQLNLRQGVSGNQRTAGAING